MEKEIENLSKLISKEILNTKLWTKSMRSIKTSGMIVFFMWLIAALFFIFTTSYAKENTVFISLMCVGGFFILFGILIPLIWIISINKEMKKYFNDVYQNKRNKLFGLVNRIPSQIKVYETSNNKLELVHDGKRTLIDEQDTFKLQLHFRITKGKSYYLLILETTSVQIATHICKTINEVWKK